MECDDPAKLAAIAALKDGVHYQPGTRRPYRQPPADFVEVFSRFGWGRALNEHYACNDRTIARWIEECGGDAVRDARAAVTGHPYAGRRCRYPTYAQAVASIMRGEAVPAIPRRVPQHKPARQNDDLHRLALDKGYRLRFVGARCRGGEPRYGLRDRFDCPVLDAAPVPVVRAWLERRPSLRW